MVKKCNGSNGARPCAYPDSKAVARDAKDGMLTRRLRAAELADALDSKSSDRKIVWVRSPPPALPLQCCFARGNCLIIGTRPISRRHARKRTDSPFIRQLFVNGLCSENESLERLVRNEFPTN